MHAALASMDRRQHRADHRIAGGERAPGSRRSIWAAVRSVHQSSVNSSAACEQFAALTIRRSSRCGRARHGPMTDALYTAPKPLETLREGLVIRDLDGSQKTDGQADAAILRICRRRPAQGELPPAAPLVRPVAAAGLMGHASPAITDRSYIDGQRAAAAERRAALRVLDGGRGHRGSRWRAPVRPASPETFSAVQFPEPRWPRQRLEPTSRFRCRWP